ncbi:MAG TPA: DUF5668 domain-containing protein [Thermoanaerobaculia bacterium]|nr:DUF5668 domain-containing protein [Thermoanaerobaculia bacterium]
MTTDDRNGAPSAFRLTPRLLLGLFALVAGALLILDNMGVLLAWDYLRFWPALLILAGLIKMTQPGGGRVVGFLIALVGAWLLADVLDVAEFDFDYVWPIVLVIAGLNLLSSEVFRRARPAGQAETDAEIDTFALLGGTKRASASQRFRGGTATAIMGGCEIDLRDAAIAQGETAVFDTFAMWGGVEIFVPESWVVVLKGVPVMGGFEDLTRHPAGGAGQRLVVRGMALMGGVEVKNAPRREAV